MATINVFVNDVLDGNTLEIGGNIGLTDAPTTVILARVYAPPLIITQGRTAKQRLKELINQRCISYKTIDVNPEGIEIAEVWLDDKNVNGWMIEQGYGKKVDWPISPDWKVK